MREVYKAIFCMVFMPKKIVISKKELEKLYLDKKLTTYQIANELSCCQATIWKRIHKHNIKPRTPWIAVNLPKSTLHDLYVNKKLSTWKIERELKIPRGTIHRKLKEYNITPRTLAQSNIKKQRWSFSGDLIEKAYLIGFRLGDLRARKPYKNSETIAVACGSTVDEQIVLIKNLFSKYCEPWISKKSRDGKVNIEAYLDLSFSFLLSKEIPFWVLNKRTYFFSFLAGFTDAEGCISKNINQCYYFLGNCRKDYLEFIKKGLEKYNIFFPNIYRCKTKGTYTYGKYIRNYDYYILKSAKKSVLNNLFLNLKPYIKHKNKVKSLKMAINNIDMRNIKFGFINMEKE